MTRQKKELWKKIGEIEEFIAVDEQLGCGFTPPDFYDDLYEEIHRMEKELAKLSHYNSVEDMMYDDRFMTGKHVEALPFM